MITVREDNEFKEEIMAELQAMNKKIQKCHEAIILVQKATSKLPKDYFETTEILTPVTDPPDGIIDFLLKAVKAKAYE